MPGHRRAGPGLAHRVARRPLLKAAAAMGGSVALGVFGTLVSFVMMLFLLFFLLRDGRDDARAADAVSCRWSRCGAASCSHYLAAVTRAVVFGYGRNGGDPGHVRRHRLRDRGAALAGGVCGARDASPPFCRPGDRLVLVPAVLYLRVRGRWGAGDLHGRLERRGRASRQRAAPLPHRTPVPRFPPSRCSWG